MPINITPVDWKTLSDSDLADNAKVNNAVNTQIQGNKKAERWYVGRDLIIPEPLRTQLKDAYSKKDIVSVNKLIFAYMDTVEMIEPKAK